jgi:hypothetical protein
MVADGTVIDGVGDAWEFKDSEELEEESDAEIDDDDDDDNDVIDDDDDDVGCSHDGNECGN